MKPIQMDELELKIIKEETTDLVILDLEGKTKEDVLLNIARFAKKAGLIGDECNAYQKFLDRESSSPTEIGAGVALPEACWIEMTRPYAFILCRTRDAIEYASPDKHSVNIIIASLGRDKEDLSRLKQMAHFVKAIKSKAFRFEFLNARTELDVYRALGKYGIGSDEIRRKYISRKKN